MTTIKCPEGDIISDNISPNPHLSYLIRDDELDDLVDKIIQVVNTGEEIEVYIGALLTTRRWEVHECPAGSLVFYDRISDKSKVYLPRENEQRESSDFT